MPAAPFPFNVGAVLTAAQLNAIGSYTSFTPTLTATVTNPVLGTGATAIGSYATLNNICFYWGIIIFGTSGSSAGSGNYRISLPLAGSGGESSIGVGRIRDASAGYVAYVCEFGFDGTNQRMNIQYGSGVALSVGATNPIPFGASDQIFFTTTYQLA